MNKLVVATILACSSLINTSSAKDKISEFKYETCQTIYFLLFNIKTPFVQICIEGDRDNYTVTYDNNGEKTIQGGKGDITEGIKDFCDGYKKTYNIDSSIFSSECQRGFKGGIERKKN